MWPKTAALILGVSCLVYLQGATTHGCVSGAPLGTFQLSVQSGAGGAGIPVRRVNMVQPGQKLLYRPLHLPSGTEKAARIALVLVPAGSPSSGDLTVLEAQPAASPAEWTAPIRAAVLGLVFGPQGLNAKKVTSLVNKDQELISQLAEYAEQTTQVETLIERLTAMEGEPDAGKNLNAALSGFAAQYGLSPAKLDRSAPTDKQALALLRTLNPALGAYDPLAAHPSTRMRQSAGLAASVAGLFFGTPVGLAAGGAAMLQNLRGLMFPDTDFRSALAQTAASEEITLCAKRQAARSRTRIAYLWALRVPNADPPGISLASEAHLPIGLKSTVAVQLSSSPMWPLLGRVREWALIAEQDSTPVPVTIKPLAQSHSLEIDLSRFMSPPGSYRLSGKWDWETFQVAGDFHLYTLSNLKNARVAVDSQDRLILGSGPVAVRLEGDDFQFVKKVALREAGDRSSTPIELRFSLPEGAPGGPRQTLEVAVDTRALREGRYQLLLSHPDGSDHEVPVRVLPPNPKLEGLPLRVNLGEARQRLTFRGAGLERIERLESESADIQLLPLDTDRRKQKILEAVVQLHEGVKKGDTIALRLKVEGVHKPVCVPDAIRVAGPRPRIGSLEGSWPEDLSVALRKGELPAGSFVSFSIRVENVDAQSAVRLQCAESEKTLTPEALRPGENHPAARLEMAGQSTLFLSLDAGAIGQAGCTLTGIVETESAGVSDPYSLGRVIRLPRIESFALTDQKLSESTYAGVLKGRNLETIEKAGWDSHTGLPVEGLPKPLLGEGQTQTLRIALPWPSPSPRAPLYIWLRGETEGRTTRVRY